MKRPLVDGIARALRWVYPAGRRGAAARPCGGTDEIRLFRDLRARDGGPPGLDARTESDLDLDAVFERVDVCSSAVGQQWLWARLRTPVADAAALAAFDSLASCLAGCERARDELRKSLSRLSGPGAYLLPFLLYGELPARPPSRRVVPVLTLAAAAAVGASLWLGVPGVLALVAICAANVVVRLSYRSELAPALGSLPAVRALLRAGVELGRAGSAVPEPARGRIAAATAPLRGLLRTTGWLALETDTTDELTHLFYEYVNFLFLLDVNALIASLDLLSTRREALLDLFDAVGELDGALATAAFRAALPSWCRPRFRAAGEGLRTEGVFHPLLEAPVANSLAPGGGSLLVTGSNMSGKTSFLKTLGVSAILGRTLATCPARSWDAPPFEVMTAIGRAESLLQGTSYYLAEVERVRVLLEAAERDVPCLLLLDELFRGTNTVERIAAGRAVLERLAVSRHFVAVASHDLELVPLLHGAYVAYHFREEIVGGALTFDHRLRPGSSSTRNAIALLACSGYPPEVVAAAHATVDELRGAATSPRAGTTESALPAGFLPSSGQQS